MYSLDNIGVKNCFVNKGTMPARFVMGSVNDNPANVNLH